MSRAEIVVGGHVRQKLVDLLAVNRAQVVVKSVLDCVVITNLAELIGLDRNSLVQGVAVDTGNTGAVNICDYKMVNQSARQNADIASANACGTGNPHHIGTG